MVILSSSINYILYSQIKYAVEKGIYSEERFRQVKIVIKCFTLLLLFLLLLLLAFVAVESAF
jgi:hypothetical protein